MSQTINITKSRPEALPATVADLIAHRNKVAPPNLNDNVERLYVDLYSNPRFQRYLDACWSEDTQEGSLYADDLMAAQMVREHASSDNRDPYVASKKLATIARALNVVQARYDLTRKARASRVGGTEVRDAAD